MRDGDPLPGVSPAQVVSQLAHRVFDPLHLSRVRMVLDYHGLADPPAGPLAAVAARHGVTTRTVSLHVQAVRSAGATLPLSPELIADVTRRSTPTEDHLGRVRIANTLALTTPHRPSPPAKRAASVTHQAPVQSALRVLAAVGPLGTKTLLESVLRSRRFRDRRPFSVTDLESALTRCGARASAGRWSAPTGVDVPDRYRSVIAFATGRDLTRAEMIQVLIDAGYSRSSANGRMSSSHPLIQRVGPNRYRVIDTDTAR